MIEADNDEADVDLIDLDDMVMVLDTGERVPITNLIESSGAETDTVVLATACVAGPTQQGRWISCTISDDDRLRSGIRPPPRVITVNGPAEHVYFEDGSILPIQGWLDDKLDETDPSSAAFVDAGPDQTGYSVRVSLEAREGFEVIR